MNSWLLEFNFNKDILKDPVIAGVCINNVGSNICNLIGKLKLVYEDRGNLIENGFVQLYQTPGSSALIQGTSAGLLTIDIHDQQSNSTIDEQAIEFLRKEIFKLEDIFTRKTLEFKSLPAIKRGQNISVYDRTSHNTLVEYDYDKLVFDEDTAYQNVRILHSPQFGNCLVLDNDMNLAESDLPYTIAITGDNKEDFTGKDVLVLGAGDGGILHYLRDKGPKMITMIEIDETVIQAARLHLRGICHDALDTYEAENYSVIVGDCIEYLKKYVKEGRTFDYVINDLTAIPISTAPVGSHWEFLKLILNLSMEVLKESGKYFTQGNGANNTKALAMYEEQLQKLSFPVSFSKQVVCVPSYHELWVFYTLWKTSAHA